ncbi:cytochrome P450 [Basidiobolus meristosporus CBS 931.73]|uniref:Cytochrome P450 n=1 Tax=Basidiobolus meristosporus CBS 931.73 TaxID=1314790 RepID=A0A1Y1Y418_9FUNG|nr:cytochrome P450 [Basidiobolus meristosporus CBS 931.73]|eukprot:ORX92456.1 cytochrome P450 [Basidiobolus meristosporus CBS 931.73]
MIAWLLYTKIQCPPALRSLPSVSLWQYLLATLASLDNSERFDKLTVPVLNKKGIGRQFIFGRWMVTVSNPDYAKTIFMKADTFPKIQLSKEQPNTLRSKLSQVNILSANDEEWKKHRRVANPAFHRSWATAAFGELVSKLIVQIGKTQGSVPVTELMQHMTLDALGRMIFDYDFNSIENQRGETVQLYNTIMTGINNPFYVLFPYLESLPLIGRRGYQDELERFNQFIMSIINSKVDAIREKEVDHEKADLVTLMVLASKEEDNTLTPEEIRNDVIIFFIAGHDTTANALATAIYYLAIHPHIQQRAREEANAVLGNGGKDVWPSFAQQQSQFPFITAIIKESMRLNPSAPQVVPRRCTKPVQFGEYVLPVGTPVNVHIYSVHHNPNNWENPYGFMPERFMDDEAEHDLHSWIPFGGGLRRCIGMNFSLIEQRVVLSMLLRKFVWSLPKDSIHFDRLKTKPSAGLMAIRDLNVDFRPLY